MAGLYGRGLSVTAPRSLLHPRMTGLVIAFLVLLAGSLVGLVSIAPRHEPHELLLFFSVVASALAPIAVIVFGRFVRLHQRAQSIASSPPRGSMLVPTIELDTLPEQPTLGTATATDEIVIVSVRDLGSWIPRDDAWVECGELSLEGQALRLEHGTGTLTWDSRDLAREVEPADGYRVSARTSLPTWMRDPNRAGDVRRLVISRGTELIVRGGRVADGALWGTRENPLHLTVRQR